MLATPWTTRSWALGKTFFVFDAFGVDDGVKLRLNDGGEAFRKAGLLINDAATRANVTGEGRA
jgi:hypothetical protein